MSRFFGTLLFFYIFSCPLFCTTADEWVRKTEETFLKAKTVQAVFTLRIDWKLRDTIEVKSGKIDIYNPDRYRVALDDALFISNGETFYRYSGKGRQLVINDVLDVQQDLTPGSWLFRYSDHYRPVSLDSAEVLGEKCYAVSMVSKGEARFQKLTVWISPAAGLLKKIETTDKNDNTAAYLIAKLTFDAPLPASLFSFKPPKGTEVIDMRE